MKIKSKILFVGVVALAGCAHSAVEKKLDVKLASESSDVKTGDLTAEAEKLLAEDPRLADGQKNELRALWNSTRTKMDSLHEDSLKLRSLLINEVISENSNPREIDVIKTKLSDVEHERLSEYFSAVRETNRILGRWGSEAERERFYQMMEFSDPYYMRDYL